MQLTNQEFALLEAYGDNILSTVEAEKLRNRLTTDADFSTEAMPFLQTVAILRQGRKQHVLAYLRNVENGLPNIMLTQRTQHIWFKFAAAAAVIVAFALAWLLLAQPNPTSEQTADNIVSEYMQPYTTIGILKDGAITTARAQAMTAYANAEYPKVIQYINNISDAERMPLDVFYLGYAHLATKDYSKAQSLFESIHNQSEAPLAATSYYLALCHVAQLDNKGAENILQAIQDDGSIFSEKAKQLSAKLKSLR